MAGSLFRISGLWQGLYSRLYTGGLEKSQESVRPAPNVNAGQEQQPFFAGLSPGFW